MYRLLLPLLLLTGSGVLAKDVKPQRAAPVEAPASATLEVGGTRIRFPLAAGEVQGSRAAPTVFSLTQAAIPATNRLVEIIYQRSDIPALNRGDAAQRPFVQVQVMRSVETVDVAEADWEQFRPQLASTMRTLDINAVMQAEDAASSRRLSEQSGQDVQFSLGEVSSPAVYFNTNQSLRYQMVVPLQLNVNGQLREARLAVAGAVLPVKRRLLFIYVYQHAHQDRAMASAREILDQRIRQLLALNP